MKNIKNLFWALQNEPDRLWAWMHRHNPFTKKRYGLFEAAKAVCENPRFFDKQWDIDMEKLI